MMTLHCGSDLAEKAVLVYTLFWLLWEQSKLAKAGDWVFCINRFNIEKSWCWNRRKKSKQPEEVVNSTSTEHSLPSFPHTHGIFGFWIPKIPFSSASSLHPSANPSDSSRRTNTACNVIKQQQRTKKVPVIAWKQTGAVYVDSSIAFTPVTGGISLQTVRYNLPSQNMQHILEAKEVMNPFSAEQQSQQTNEGIIDQHTQPNFLHDC